MTITKVANVIVETEVKEMAQFLRTGVIRDSEFALCDESDRLKQIKFDASPLVTDTTLTIRAGAASSGVLTLPNVATGTIGLQGEMLQYSAPTTGQSITISAGNTALILEPAGTLATLTVTLPIAPGDGWLVKVSSTAIITALTLSAGAGDTIVNAITTLAAAGFAEYVYRASTLKWYRVG